MAAASTYKNLSESAVEWHPIQSTRSTYSYSHYLDLLVTAPDMHAAPLRIQTIPISVIPATSRRAAVTAEKGAEDRYPIRNAVQLRDFVVQNAYVRKKRTLLKHAQNIREVVHYLRDWLRAQDATFDTLCRKDAVTAWRVCFKSYARALSAFPSMFNAPGMRQVADPRKIADCAVGFGYYFTHHTLRRLKETSDAKHKLKALMRARAPARSFPLEQGRRFHRLSWGILDLPPKGPSKLRQSYTREELEAAEAAEREEAVAKMYDLLTLLVERSEERDRKRRDLYQNSDII